MSQLSIRIEVVPIGALEMYSNAGTVNPFLPRFNSPTVTGYGAAARKFRSPRRANVHATVET